MSEAEKFMHWMIKIGNIHYANDIELDKALVKFRKIDQNVNRPSK